MTASKKRHVAHSRNNHHRTSAYLAMTDRAASAIEGMTPQLAMLRDKGLESAEALEKTIVQHPKKSILVAFGIGYLLARLGRYL
jgi:hypothetical protein